MLQVVIFSLSFLLGGVLSQQCGDFTTNDVEGPFFVSNVPRKVGFRLYLFVSHHSTMCTLSTRLLLTMTLRTQARERSSEDG